jgi:hypothetical protein
MMWSGKADGRCDGRSKRDSTLQVRWLPPSQSKENTMRPTNIAYGLLIVAISLTLAYAELRAEAVLNAGAEPILIEALLF